MVGKLESIVKELNPLHDFDRFKFYKMSEVILADDSDQKFDRLRKNLRFMLWTPKHLIRGMLIGASMGALAGMMSSNIESSNDFYVAVVASGLFGSQLDMLQYLYRGVINLYFPK